MSKIFLIILIIAVATFVYYISSQNQYELRKPVVKGPVIAFGDSLVFGVGASKDKDFVSLISKQIGEEVVNAGVPGDTTYSALNRLQADVLDNNPRIVIILLGGNDFLQRTPKEQTIANLAQIISQIQSKGAGVVLVGVRQIIYSSDYEKLARETGSVYVPNILDETYGRKELMTDLVHPNDNGYQIFADKIIPALQDLQE